MTAWIPVGEGCATADTFSQSITDAGPRTLNDPLLGSGILFFSRNTCILYFVYMKHLRISLYKISRAFLHLYLTATLEARKKWWGSDTGMTWRKQGLRLFAAIWYECLTFCYSVTPVTGTFHIALNFSHNSKLLCILLCLHQLHFFLH